MTPAGGSGSLVWFRRDLRDFDHAALAYALGQGAPVYAAFVFDREILDSLPSPKDRRVEFIRESVFELDRALRRRGGGLITRHGFAREEIPWLARTLNVAAVAANHDYEPAAMDRDAAVAQALAYCGISFAGFKDQVIFERSEIRSGSGTPFSVFTPYKRTWLKLLEPRHLASHDVDAHANALVRPPEALDGPVPALDTLGFAATGLAELGIRPGMIGGATLFADFRKRIDRYQSTRDFPALKGPSYLSVHLRFGTVSVRELAAFAYERSLRPDGAGAATWLSELVWRDFYAQILWHHPRVVDTAFRPEYATIPYPNDRGRFEAWCEARTGYPIVDAAMRQLNATGYMHNRLRMIAASFLVKDLHVDWRWGERVFAERLIDFDLASNNGGWQWAASTGCDAQPYFRIFNPVLQSMRFDPVGKFLRRYLPELARLPAEAIHAPWEADSDQLARWGVVLGRDYPAPIVDHANARQVALSLFGRRDQIRPTP